MAENSKIEWTWQRVPLANFSPEAYQLAVEIGSMLLPPDGDAFLVPGYTFNPFIGCTKVDELCAHCYAAEQDKFRGWTPEGWGPGKPRKRTSAANWAKVRKWNEIAGKLGVRQRVFCASLADWLDDDGVPAEWLGDLLALINECGNLDWLLLTKRPEKFRPRLAEVAQLFNAKSFEGGELGPRLLLTSRTAQAWLDGTAPASVWAGTSVGHQKSADLRIPQLLQIPARVRFLSCEPMLGPVDLRRVVLKKSDHPETGKPDMTIDALTGWHGGADDDRSKINWVICGGESGPGSRPMHPAWARSLRDQCAAAGVAFLFKQWGEYVSMDEGNCWSDPRMVELDGTNSTGWTIDRHSATTALMARVGKARAGRLLDGIEHNDSPEVSHA